MNKIVNKKNSEKKTLLIGISVIFISIISFLVFKELFSKDTFASSGTIDGNIVLDCGTEKILPNEIFECSIEGRGFVSQVSGIEIKLDMSDTLTLEEVVVDENLWFGDGDDGFIALYTGTNKTGNFEIAKIKVRANDVLVGDDSTISLNDILIVDNMFSEYSINSQTVDIRISSNVAALESLTLKIGNDVINADLSSTTVKYTTDADKIFIQAKAANEKAIVNGLGIKNINYGENKFEIVVIAEDDTTVTYTIIINRLISLEFSSEVIVDENKLYLKFYKNNPTVNDILNEITTNGVVVISDIDGKTVNDSNVATGYTISIKFGSNEKKYTIIIYGDVNGDGKISVTDVTMIYQKYRGKDSTKDMKEVNIEAGNVVVDNKISLNDVAKLYQFSTKTIGSLK